MRTFELLLQLRAAGAKLWVEGQQLRINAPKGAITPALQQEIAARKVEIMDFLLAENNLPASAAAQIRQADNRSEFPLSFYQEEIWPFIEQNPGSNAYQIVRTRSIKFPLNIIAFENAVNETVRRHEILRTTFADVEGNPTQIVRDPGISNVEWIDLQYLPEVEREKALHRLVNQKAWEPLDIKHGPLFRVILFSVSASNHVLLMLLHYLTTDCMGVDILEAEISQLYAAYAAGNDLHLDELDFQYGDFAVWQNQQYQRGAFDNQMDYWRKILGASPPRIEQIAGYPLNNAQSPKAEQNSILLSEDQYHELNELARKNQATLFITLLAAYEIFLSQLCGQTEYLIEVPIANRNRPGLEGMVGRFLNTLLIRASIDTRLTFQDHLARVRESVLDALSHQDAPYSRLAEGFIRKPGPAGMNFSTMQFNFAPMADAPPVSDDSVLGYKLDRDETEARYALTLYVDINNNRLALTFISPAGLIPLELKTQLLAQFQAFLEEITGRPDSLIQTRLQALNDDEPAGDTGLDTASADRSLLPLDLGDNSRQACPHPSLVHGSSQEFVEETIKRLWIKMLKVNAIDSNDNFFALGGHSLQAMQMLIQIQELFETNIPFNKAFKQPTVAQIAQLVQAQIGKTAWSSLVEIKPTGTRPPFYCTHGITGDTVWFEHLIPYVFPDQPFYGLQSRGLDGVRQPLETIEEMASWYIQEIRNLQPVGPYYILGYSNGGSIAYEMACQLERAGQVVALLLIIDSANPRSGYYAWNLTPQLLVNLVKNLPHRISDILHLRPDEALARIARKLRVAKANLQRKRFSSSQQPTPVRADELIDYAASLPVYIQNIIVLNYEANQKYTPRPYHGKLTLMRAQYGRLFSSHDPLMGWGELADEVDVRLIRGSHLSIFKEPYVGDLAKVIQQCVAEAQQTSQTVGLGEK